MRKNCLYLLERAGADDGELRPAHRSAEDVHRAAAPPEHRRGGEVVGEHRHVRPVRDLLGERQRRGADVDANRFAPADHRRRRPRDRRLRRRVPPPPAGERRLVGVEHLAAPDADGAAMRAHQQALVLERPKIAPDRHLRDGEAVGDLRHRDEAVAVDEVEDAGVAGARGNASDLEFGIHHQRGSAFHLNGHIDRGRSYSNIIAKSSVR